MRIHALLIVSLAAVLALMGCGGRIDDNPRPHYPEPSLITTASGLQYADYEYGTGSTTSPGDVLLVHYSASVDGHEFANTFGGEPIEYTKGLDPFNEGWQEGLNGMRIGGKRKIVVPPNLGYGEEGHPPDVPPNATITYYVHLLDFKPLTRTNLPSGLSYVDQKLGEGPMAATGDTVKVAYTGWLTDGTKFDSGELSDLKLGSGQVIKGWEEGIPGMQVGGRRKLIIPPELGYGDEGHGPMIPPESTLIFVVDLLELNKGS